MRNLKCLFLLIIPALTLLTACSDDDSESAGKYQITKLDLSASGDGIYTFEYDSNNRVKVCNQLDAEGEKLFWDTFEYDSNGKLIKQYKYSSALGESAHSNYHFTYNADTVYSALYGIEEEYNRTDTLILNSNRLLKARKSKGFFNTYYKCAYEYDSRGNLTKSTETYGATQYVYTYEYDDKKSLLSNTGLPQWSYVYFEDSFLVFAGENNVVKVIVDGNEGVVTYKYNESGYPTESSDEDGNLVKMEYRAF